MPVPADFPHLPHTPQLASTPPVLEKALARLLEKDQHQLQTTEVPIITVSASFKEDLKGWYGLPENESLPDVVFSRAHYSMAIGLATAVWGKELDKDKAWIFDPTNYVNENEWQKIKLTETIAKTLARHAALKSLKDVVDKWGRTKLPILSSIKPSLLYVTHQLKQPVLSLHIASGNILAEEGHTVLQVVTDPHVRADYLVNADRPNMLFCVFDHKTKLDFLEQAAAVQKPMDPDRVIVTGPPVDPRVVAARAQKHAWQPARKLRLCLTTGGVGTNKSEIESILVQLLPFLRTGTQFQVIIYCGTQRDIYDWVCQKAAEYQIRLGSLTDEDSALRVFYHPQIVDANELLISHAFPWSDGFITKPSGDMAYDAVAAGCFLLTLKEWGEWEHNVRAVFEQRDISRPARTEAITNQLELLMSPLGHHASWITQAMQKTRTLDPLFTTGAANIIREYRKIKKALKP